MTNATTLQTCALCGAEAAFSTVVKHEFDYRHGKKFQTLSVDVPVVDCSECGESYFGEGAEELKHDAVCEFLGRLSPRDIIELRKRLGMSQAELADHTGIGIASIKRWETGLVIQGAALDRQLRNLELSVKREPQSPWAGSFRTPISDTMRRRAKAFSLRPAPGRQLEAASCT
jgi:putative zinc finger/helix-turn-helix YgiT family protein